MHVADVVAPKVVEYLPAPQFTQELATVAPVVVRYLPASQLVHVLDPAAEYLPATHVRQSAVPIVSLYMPAAHAEHVGVPVQPAEVEMYDKGIPGIKLTEGGVAMPPV